MGTVNVHLGLFLPIVLPGLDAERLIYALEDKEVYVSTGAACAASKGVKSPTLQAIGLSDVEIAGSLRITMGKHTDEQAVIDASKIIHDVINVEIERLGN